MSHTKLIFLTRLLIIFAIYFVSAKFGLNLQAVSKFATLVWIPTGFSLAMLLLFGFQYWPAITLGAFLVNFLTGAPVFVAAGIAIGNTAEAAFGFFILRKVFDFINSMSRLKDVLSLVVIAAPFAAAVSATVGVTGLLFGSIISSSQYFITWIPWWVGDVISILIITPVILLWSFTISYNKKLSRIIEFIFLLFIVLAVGVFIFHGVYRFPVKNPSAIYLVYPPIIWAALRFGQREVAAILLIFSGMAIWDTMQGLGPFAGVHVTVSLLYLQIFMIITAITSMILAVVVAERRRLEERKDDFISMASHELRIPVTSSKLYIQLVKTKIEEKRYSSVKKYLLKLDDQLDKLSVLVLDLLDISRMQSGKIQINKTKFDLNILIFETVETLQRTTTVHKIIIKGKIASDVNADRDRIYQVLVNLITNAIKYSPDGGKIIVFCKKITNYIQISVEDTGVGIAKNHLQRIFEKLYRIPTMQNGTTIPGLGIGLYVSSEIVKLHKGKIWAVNNKKRKGSTFYFTLPA